MMRRELNMLDPHGTVAPPMRERVVITGIGCVSCFGTSFERYGDALLGGDEGIRAISRFDTSTCRSHRAATIQEFDPAAFISPLKLRRIDEVGRVAIAAAKMALDAADWKTAERSDD